LSSFRRYFKEYW